VSVRFDRGGAPPFTRYDVSINLFAPDPIAELISFASFYYWLSGHDRYWRINEAMGSRHAMMAEGAD
jgi:hypothetical protein